MSALKYQFTSLVVYLKTRKKWLSNAEFNRVLKNFTGEILGLLRLKCLEIIPVLTPIILNSWSMIIKEHVSEADALQIQTCKYSGSNLFLSSDKELIRIASKAGFKAINVEDKGGLRRLLDC